jgi:hypothetical protein
MQQQELVYADPMNLFLRGNWVDGIKGIERVVYYFDQFLADGGKEIPPTIVVNRKHTDWGLVEEDLRSMG